MADPPTPVEGVDNDTIHKNLYDLIVASVGSGGGGLLLQGTVATADTGTRVVTVTTFLPDDVEAVCLGWYYPRVGDTVFLAPASTDGEEVAQYICLGNAGIPLTASDIPATDGFV